MKSPYIWTGDYVPPPEWGDLNAHIKAFSEKMAGHLRREWAYRNFIRQTLDGLKPQISDQQLEWLEKEFERLQKL